MQKNDVIVITGGNGQVGSALFDELKAQGHTNIVALTSADCDLTDFQATVKLFQKLQPKYIFHLAALVFGIMGNMKNKGRSFFSNVLINTHVIEASRMVGVEKIVAMGSGCVYPFPSPGIPLKEDMIWLGEPHFSENSYAHAKRAMLAQLNAYQESYNLPYAFVISANLFGPHDKFDTQYGHVIPSLVRKFYEAKKNKTEVTIWGDGSAQRDFLYVADVAKALMIIMRSICGPVNMGSGRVNSIKDVVNELSSYIGFSLNQINWDISKPNGQDYRSYDLSKLFTSGFSPQYTLGEGLRLTYDWYEQHALTARK